MWKTNTDGDAAGSKVGAVHGLSGTTDGDFEEDDASWDNNSVCTGKGS